MQQLMYDDAPGASTPEVPPHVTVTYGDGERVRELYTDAYAEFRFRRLGVHSNYWAEHRDPWDGGRIDGVAVPPVWTKIAAFGVHHGITPQLLIETAFDRPGSTPPTPDELISPDLVEQARQRFERLVADERVSLESMMVRFGSLADTHEHMSRRAEGSAEGRQSRPPARDSRPAEASIRGALVRGEFPPLFEFAMAVSAKLTNRIDDRALVDAAMRQFATQPEVYLQAWPGPEIQQIAELHKRLSAINAALDVKRPPAYWLEPVSVKTFSHPRPKTVDLGTLDPREAVERWKVIGVGRRPSDYMARDNLVGSLVRDPKAKQLQAMQRRPPQWLADTVAHLPHDQRGPATQIQALHYLQRECLARVLPADDETPDEEAVQLFGASWNCYPYGVLYERPRGRAAKVCGRPRLCTWCHARQVERLYGSLVEGPFRRPAGTHLLAIRVRLATGPIARQGSEPRISVPDHVMQRCLTGQYQDYDNWYMGGDSTLQFHRSLQPEQVESARELLEAVLDDKLAAALDEDIERLPVRGGIRTLQFGPAVSDGGHHDVPYYGFEVWGGLLGEVDLSEPSERRRFESMMERLCPAVQRVLPPSCVKSALLVPASHEALRVLLAGSSARYDLLRLPGLKANADYLGRGFPDGVPGVLSQMPLYLLDPVQLWSLAATTKHLRLYSRFGSWRRGTKAYRSNRSRGNAVKASLPAVPAAARKTAKPTKISKQTRSAARSDNASPAARRARLLETARPLWHAVYSRIEFERGVGRPPYRRLLAEALEQAGWPVSKRDMDWLMARLRDRAGC